MYGLFRKFGNRIRCRVPTPGVSAATCCALGAAAIAARIVSPLDAASWTPSNSCFSRRDRHQHASTRQ
jgi:hypothetical protein